MQKRRIAIAGGGPGGLFLFKNLLRGHSNDFTVDIFEANEQLGYGMPYSWHGANNEHITNVSGNEIPKIVTPFVEWLKTVPADTLKKYEINPKTFNDYKVIPRLLFGDYLNAQFSLLLQKAESAGIETTVYLKTKVSDIKESTEKNKVWVEFGSNTSAYDHVIICTGHTWPKIQEGKVPGYFDSPYPPTKLKMQLDHPVAIKGSSLTAIDAIRTLARSNGHFTRNDLDRVSFISGKGSENFKIVMHSLKGLLPAIRFHLEDSHLSKDDLLSREEIKRHMKSNDGFLSLDFIFEKDYKEAFRDKDKTFYAYIKDMTLEEFVNDVMDKRERIDPFLLFQAEYDEAKKSIERKKSIYWKEMLAVLSFAMNYPAKHFSAEDMMRLQKVLMPLISIVIAFVPQNSCEEMIAMHDVGKLQLISVEEDSHVEVDPDKGITYYHTDEDGKSHETIYETYIDCTGQRHLSFKDFPFKSLIDDNTLKPARLKFKSAEKGEAMFKEGNKEIERDTNNEYYLLVPGVAISDTFRAVGYGGESNSRIYIMAVPYIGGYNPDYSGLDFCEEASSIIVKDIF